MKLSTWAKGQGVTYHTAWKWYHAGTLPVPAHQLPNGTIFVDVDAVPVGQVVVYARVSGHDRKADLDGQALRCIGFANSQGLAVDEVVTEIGSGMNGHRSKLLRLLADKTVGVIVVEHGDRLMRFGGEYVSAAMNAHGARLVVVDATELEDDLAQDVISVLTSFCARLYGRRSAKHRAQRAMMALGTVSE